MNKAEWSPWFKFDPRTISDKAPDQQGVYRIRQEREIKRLGEKCSNLIYIGGTRERGKRKSLRERLLDIFKGNHTACECIIRLIKAGRDLEFSFIETDSPETKESELKREYKDEYWELPPCNRAR